MNYLKYFIYIPPLKTMEIKKIIFYFFLCNLNLNYFIDFFLLRLFLDFFLLCLFLDFFFFVLNLYSLKNFIKLDICLPFILFSLKLAIISFAFLRKSILSSFVYFSSCISLFINSNNSIYANICLSPPDLA